MSEKLARFVSVALVASGLGICLLSATPPASEIPPLLYVSDPDYSHPVWVAAEAAFDASGQLDDKLFASSAAWALSGHIEDNEVGTCIELGERWAEVVNPPDLETLDRSIANTPLVVVARVMARAFGFHGDTPGQLFRLDPEEILKGEAWSDHFFVFFPVGTFTAGPHRFCKRDARFPETPELGDRLLLTVPVSEDSNEPFLDLWYGANVVVLKNDGSLRLPAAFAEQELETETASGLLEFARSAVRTQRSPGK